MLQWLKELDRLLRGEATSPSALRQGMVPVPALGLTVLIVILGMLYGLCMGSYALFNRNPPEVRQLLAVMLKVPALFLLTLLVTFPSLYVFNALVGSRLSLLSLLRLMIATVAVMMTVLASFGPIVAFFSVTTPNYPFISLLNVLLFSVAGSLGLVFLLQTLHRLSIAGTEPVEVLPADAAAPANAPVDPRPAGALDRLQGKVVSWQVKTVFRIWLVVFAVVGAQMAWVLRPFIGDPSLPFEVFRARQSNFFEAVWRALISLFR